MYFTTSRLILDPSIKIEISHKVSLYVRKKVNDLFVAKGLDLVEPDVFINLIASPTREESKVIVKGPDLDKRNNTIDWAAYLPYDEIESSDNHMEPFLRAWFVAAEKILLSYDISSEELKEIEKVVFSEVLNNPEYIYEEKNKIPPPDLSFLDDM